MNQKINISDFNNEWNKKALELSRREVVRGIDKIIAMSSQHPGEIENIGEIDFHEFYQSRWTSIVAKNRADYFLQRAGKALQKPWYYVQFRLYQILNAL